MPDPAPTTARGAVFISYAREDSDAARRIAEALRSHGVEVWFDQNELRGGDAWDAKIRRQIADCALFLPVVSQHTQERSKGYFRLEWKLAVEQTHLMAEGLAYLAPVVIDDTAESSAVVPPEFLKVQWTRLPGALPSPQFVEQVKRLLEAPRKAATPIRAAGKTLAGSAPEVGRALRARPWVPYVATVGIVLLLVAGVALTRRNELAARRSAPPTAEKSVTPAANDKSIAVLPFENRSTEKENEFFTDGIHDDILAHLSRIRALHVISRTSVMEYRGTKKKIPQIARELGVAWVLEGSVQRSGSKVHVVGQLINARTDEHLWAQDYNRDLSAADIFTIQSDLAQEIARSLSATLSPEEKALVERRSTENLAALDLYLKARDLDTRSVSRYSRLSEREAFLQRAVQLDPNFAAAWAALAVVDSYSIWAGIALAGRAPA